MNHHRIVRCSPTVALALALTALGLAGCSKSAKLLAPDATGANLESASTAAPLEFGRSEGQEGGEFVAYSTNKYFPLIPGTTWYYRAVTPDGVETSVVRVTNETVLIDGVRVRVVTDIVKLDGELIEETRDYFAMDREKNVWYFGEDTRSIDPETGEESTHGTWRAGVNGAQKGIIMLGDPDRGEAYAEENAPGVAEDQARVVSLHAEAKVPAGEFDDALKTENTTPLEPDVLENKYYAPGVGMVLTIDRQDGTRDRLVRFTRGRLDRGDDDDDDLRGPVANRR
jgi:hypothetical protein